MKKYALFSLMAITSLLLTSCEAVGDIFKAGMWWGIIVVLGIIGLVIWLLTRGRGGSN